MVENLLLRGKRDDAVTKAVEVQDWGLAMMLACVCGPEKYQEVVKAYSSAMFPDSSALHLLSMVYSNQGLKTISQAPTTIPTGTKFMSPSGDVLKGEENSTSGIVSNWRANLAALLSNKTGDWEMLVKTFGTRIQKESNVSLFNT